MAHITAQKLYLVLIYLILIPNVEPTMMIVYSTFSYLVRDNTRHFQKLNENLNVVTFPSTTGYLMPLRAINTAGKWRIVVNGVKAHYETLTQVQSVNSTTQKFDPILSLQTARVEECSTPGSPCPLVPACYDTHCVQVRPSLRGRKY